MASLFIANTTTQDHIFNWRLPENHKIFSMPIPAGSQAQVLRDATDFNFRYVVEQHSAYGLMSLSEAKAANTQGNKVNLVYSDGPLPAEIYGITEEINDEIASNQIQREKELTAISMIKSVEQNPELNEGIKSVELEIIEDIPKESTRKGKDRVIQKFTSDIKR